MNTLANIAKMYAAVRDVTLNNADVDSSDKIAVLELVKAEIVNQKLRDISNEAMNA